MLRYIVMTIGLLLLSQAGWAQPEGRFSAGDFAKIKRAHRAFFTEQLELTEGEADAFFPVYWEQQAKIRQHRREDRWNRFQASGNEMTEEEALKALREQRERKEAQVKLREAAERAYLSVLPAAKVLRIENVERQFRQRLLGSLKARRAGRGPD